MADSTPRFRQDLIATAVEVDGVRYIDVRDPSRGTGFRFYDFEFELARQLDGRPHADVSAWAIATYGLDLTPVGIGEFAARLAELGFLEGSAPSPTGAAAPTSAASPSGGALPVRSGTPTLIGPPSPDSGPVPARGHDEDSRPLSEVVNRVVEGASSHAPTAVTVNAMVVASPRRPSSEFPIMTRPSSPSQPTVSARTGELEIGGGRANGSREPAPIESPAGETMMGFAAVTEPTSKPREMTVEPSDAMGTVMGFAAVTDEQVREAEAARASSPPSPPAATGERRMPPRPESVVMSPFQQSKRSAGAPRRRRGCGARPPAPPTDRRSSWSWSLRWPLSPPSSATTSGRSTRRRWRPVGYG